MKLRHSDGYALKLGVSKRGCSVAVIFEAVLQAYFRLDLQIIKVHTNVES